MLRLFAYPGIQFAAMVLGGMLITFLIVGLCYWLRGDN